MAQVMPCLAISLLVFTMAITMQDGHRPAAVVLADELDIGVCYGMVADNLPPATEVISLYKQNHIFKLRLFDPNPEALQALRGSQILVSLGVRNEDIPNIALSVDAATSWFSTNVQPYLNDVIFAYISVGNEYPIPGEIASNVVTAMKNLRSVLDSHNLKDLKLTTAVAMSVMGASYPPSAGDFSAEAKPILVDILGFLSATGSPIMVNIYPYFSYASDPVNIRLDYALFNATEAVVVDGSLSYQNLFDAMIDAFSWAIEKQGFSVGVTVSESGWPSGGNGAMTTPELASTYNKNFVKYILSRVGTPKRPGAYIDAFIFAMFNEDRKAAGVEQNWGLFYPNKEPVYPVF